MSKAEFAGLIAAEALAARLGAEDLVILDIRTAADGASAAFEAGHIPGAVHSDYAADGWRAKVGNAPGLLPPLDRLAALAGRLGIRPHDDVVIVAAGTAATDFAAAARVYWTLKFIGHGQQAILDGGFRGWSADPERPVAPCAAGRRASSTRAARAISRAARKPPRRCAPAISPVRSSATMPAPSTAAGSSPATSWKRCSRACRRGRWCPIAIPATPPRRTGSCCRRSSAATRSRSMTAR
jgi:rhodanese-related sulfurtransferase